MGVIPSAVGRLDDVVEAIREGRRGEAVNLLWNRGKEIEKKRNAAQLAADAANAEMRSVLDFAEAIGTGSEPWGQARRACGWPGVDGDDRPVETLPPVKPALRAKELPIGTVMVLGGRKYMLQNEDPMVYAFCDGWSELMLWTKELQELIDRGVRFELPKGGA